VRLLNFKETYIRWLLAMALSTVLTTMVGMVLVYSGQWAIDRVLSGTVGITLIGVLLDIVTWKHRASEDTANRSGGE